MLWNIQDCQKKLKSRENHCNILFLELYNGVPLLLFRTKHLVSQIFKDMSFGCLDPRKEVAQRGRSVNLALSVRGIESLRAVGAEGLVILKY